MTEIDDLKSDAIPQFIYKKMERYRAGQFVGGAVRVGSLTYFRNIPDPSGKIVDADEGAARFLVTEAALPSPLLGDVPAGTLVVNHDNRLVFCASAHPNIPSDALDPKYDTWVEIETIPFVEQVDRALCVFCQSVREPLDRPIFRTVRYTNAGLPYRNDHIGDLMNNAIKRSRRWCTKKVDYAHQEEVRIGWLIRATLDTNIPIDLVVGDLSKCTFILP
jgi:hypothetical protein